MSSLKYFGVQSRASSMHGGGFRSSKWLAAAALAFGVSACGTDGATTVQVTENTDPTSAICSGNVSAVKSNKEVTTRQGETFVFPNGYKMTLLDIEAVPGQTKRALFILEDSSSNYVKNIDLPEGREILLEFPSGTTYTLVACSVRAGYTFGEKSATVRSNVNLSLESNEGTCIPAIQTVTQNSVYNYDLAAATQTVETRTQTGCGADPVTLEETSTFSPAIQANLDGYGNGLPLSGKNKVTVLGEDFVLLSITSAGPTVAKEAVSGIVNVGEALLASGSYRVELLDVTDSGATVKVTNDTTGWNTTTTLPLASLYTSVTTPDGEMKLKLYATAPGYTLGAKWADLAVISEVRDVREWQPYTNALGTFSFEMSWAPQNKVAGWHFERQ